MRHDRVIEVAVVRLRPDLEVDDEWTTLVNPCRDIYAGADLRVGGDAVAVGWFDPALAPPLAFPTDTRLLKLPLRQSAVSGGPRPCPRPAATSVGRQGLWTPERSGADRAGWSADACRSTGACTAVILDTVILDTVYEAKHTQSGDSGDGRRVLAGAP